LLSTTLLPATRLTATLVLLAGPFVCIAHDCSLLDAPVLQQARTESFRLVRKRKHTSILSASLLDGKRGRKKKAPHWAGPEEGI
jgi:hypothetical protein